LLVVLAVLELGGVLEALAAAVGFEHVRGVETREALEEEDNQMEEEVQEDKKAATAEEDAQIALLMPDHAKRVQYTPAEKAACLNVLAACGGDRARASRIIHSKSGYGRVTVPSLRRWQKDGVDAKPKPGRPVAVAFEKQVLSRLVFSVLEKALTADGEGEAKEQCRMVANVAYSYDVIRAACALVCGEQAEWQTDRLTKDLLFSNKYVRGLLPRAKIVRRSVTASLKSLPAPAVVQARMREIQDVIVKNAYGADCIFSGDETAIFYGASPKNQCVHEGAARATAPGADDHSRYTAFLCGNAKGVMLPPCAIMPCSIKGADLSGSTVLSTLNKAPGFTPADGWTLGMWSAKLKLNDRSAGGSSELEYKRRYLIHTPTCALIMVQHKAWMDSVGMFVMCDVQLKRLGEESGRQRWLMVWDNCGPHNVDAVKQRFAAAGIDTESLPPNMTDNLQVMELVVNGALKAAIRRARCVGLFFFFQSFKNKCMSAIAKKEELPAFSPPKVTLQQGLITLLATVARLATPHFQGGMGRAFVKVGLLQIPGTSVLNSFTVYRSHERVVMPTELAPAYSPNIDEF